MKFYSLFLCSLLLLAGCGTPPSAPVGRDKPIVLSSIAMVSDLVAFVGGDKIESQTLIGKELDPHSYEFVKGDDEKLEEATLIFYVGLGLEHGGSVCRYLESSAKAVALGAKILAEQPERLICLSGQIDPHIWMDVSLWKEIVPPIVEALSKLAPEHSGYFIERGARLQKNLVVLHNDIYHQIQKLPCHKRYLVTSHNAFNYFCKAYFTATEWRKRIFSPEGLAPDGQISLHELRAIISAIKAHHISVVFSEAYASLDPLNKIVDRANAEGASVSLARKPLYSDSIGEAGSYEQMMRYNAGVIYEELAR